MCQKAADFVSGGKLSQDGSVSQHTPGKKREGESYASEEGLEAGMETEYPESSLLKGARLSLAASTAPGLEHVFQPDHQVTEKY